MIASAIFIGLILCLIAQGIVCAAPAPQTIINQAALFKPLTPGIISIAPNSGHAGTTVSVTIAGTNFSKGSEVFLSTLVDTETRKIRFREVKVFPPSQITGKILIPKGTQPGKWRVGVKQEGFVSNETVFFEVI
ncbi:MAG TPA: hypothetical protein VN372_06665 [Methanospirillum sp.]|nr:hypothetical protein [Methanospirillum sp.]